MDGRSTKAGASTPATPPGSIRLRCQTQRPALNEGRGLNPGDTPGMTSRNRSGPKCRSTKAGASTPATLGHSVRDAPPAPPLNEGRGLNPGDTWGRSATRSRSLHALNEGRGLNPGDTNPPPTWSAVVSLSAIAQRRPGPQPRRHIKRTGSHPNRCTGSLNEGRGLNPGDTSTVAVHGRCRSGSLNEGRGLNPGDTGRYTRARRMSTGALNEGRGLNPGDTPTNSGQPPRAAVTPTAQRRPGPQPRRHPAAALARPCREAAAQRRPGPQPRRHC